MTLLVFCVFVVLVSCIASIFNFFQLLDILLKRKPMLIYMIDVELDSV